jgi:magnesium chelatase family protein
MATIIESMALAGIDGLSVSVEVDLPRRLPATIIVGLPGSAIRESAHRVRSAIVASGAEYPKKRVVVNLAPADLPKMGTAFDLPIAIGILMAAGSVSSTLAAGTVFVGELSLDGELRPITGALALALAAAHMGAKRIVLPKACAAEAAVVDGIEVLAAKSLFDVMTWMDGNGILNAASPAAPRPIQQHIDLREVRGQHRARRALEIAAAGGHNLLLIGAPGCGKTMLAARLPTILPDMTHPESIQITRIHSVAGLLPAGSGLVEQRPFRAPHHSISNAGLMGNAKLQPGEVSLAHHGVLFLDEVPEFSRSALELLRGPLENREVRLSRARGTAVYPASFSLIAAANPCPCGFFGHPRRPCVCSPSQVDRYRNKLSGPLLDRIDLQVWTQPLSPDDLVEARPGEASKIVRTRVNSARAIQLTRYSEGPLGCNAELQGDGIRLAADPTPEALETLRSIMETHALSGRAWARILKVARTIADLAGEARVDEVHILEASSYRLDGSAA